MNMLSPKHKPVMIAFALAIMAMWGIAMTASAQNQTFAPTVLNDAGCSITVNAGQTITSALSSAPGGAVICVRAGIYNERVRMTPRHNGITLRAYPGERPIVDGTGVSLGTTSSSQFVGLFQIVASNVTIEGFEVRNSPGRGFVVGKSASSEPTSNVIIRNNIVHDSYDSGINVNGTDESHVQNILVEGNQVYDNLAKNRNGSVGGGALVFSDADNSIARGNIIYHNLGEGLAADRYSVDTILEGNISYDNFHANIYLLNTTRPLVKGNLVFCTNDRKYWKPVVDNGQTTYKAGRGIQLRDESFPNRDDSPPPGDGHIIINNIVVGCGVNFGVSSQIDGGGLVDAIVANNTFANAQGDVGPGTNNMIIEGDVTLSNSRFDNNLLIQTIPGDNVRVQYAQGTPNLSTFDVSNNLYWPSVAPSWMPGEPGRIVLDPQLVNPTLPVMGSMLDSLGFALKSNSPAINAGKAVALVTDDFFGALRSGQLDIGAAEFTSAAATGQIRVVAQSSSSNPAPQFSFTADFPPNTFQLNAGQTFESGALATGLYDVSLTPVSNWSLTSATCDDGSSPSSIDLSSGEVVTCTFVIAEDALTGTITVAKQTVPSGTTQLFSFTASYYNDGFELSDGQTHVAGSLTAGTYSVAETTPSGWSATSATCDDGSNPSAIALDAGENVTCTFVSTQAPNTGTIIVVKQTDPAGASDAFTFSTSYGSGFELLDGESAVSNPLTAGTYWVAEEALDGWTSTDASCDDGSAPSAISLAAGETVTCTFTSHQDVPVESAETIYLSARKGGTVGDITYGIEDILAYDTTNDVWSLYLDLSRVGISRNVNGFTFMDDGSVLLSFARNQPLAGLGTATAQDVVKFTPTATGNATNGSFAWYIQGADVGLTTSAEAIDALGLTPDGRVVVSTVGNAAVKKANGNNIKARDEDLLVFTATQTGANTAGHWDLYFDGSSVQGMGAEDIAGFWIDNTNGDIYVTLYTGFNIAGKRGGSRDIIRLRSTGSGYEAQLYWHGSDHGFEGVPNAFDIVR